MSIYGLTEILIHFHSFRNIDLTNQGLYQIRTRVYYQENNNKYFAIPYFYNSSRENEEILKKEDKGYNLYNLISPHTNENNTEYISKSFYIRFSDEEVEIDDFCYFRLEVPSSLAQSPLMFNFEFELNYSDSLYTMNKDKSAIANQSQMISDSEFKPVSNQIVVVYFDSSSYIESFIPISYSDNFCSILNLSLHMANLDFRLRLDQPVFLVEEDKTKNTKPKTNPFFNDKMFSFFNFFLEGSHNSTISFKTDNSGTVEAKLASDLYEKNVVPLIKTYKSIKLKYIKNTNIIIEDSMKPEYSFFTNLGPLSIYFEEDDKDIINLDENIQNVKDI